MEHMDQWMLVFDAAVSVAVILQMLILLGLYLTVRKLALQFQTVSQDVREKALPALASAQALLNESRPKIDQILEDAAKASEMARHTMIGIDGTMADLLDRTRKQVIRTDELVSRTLTRVEETTNLVQRTIVSPVRRVTAIVEGVTAGIEHFMGRKPGTNGGGNGRGRAAVPKDDLFI